LTVHTPPGGSTIPPTHEPPPWTVNCAGVTVIASTWIEVCPVFVTFAVNCELVPAWIVPKLRVSTAILESR
jgi:hypothetical protein